MEFLILAVLLGLIPAAIARSKRGGGSSSGGSMGRCSMKANREAVESRQESEGMKKCPFCAEMIKSAATVCRYCGRDLPASEPDRPGRFSGLSGE
jgi:hypothetical protein